MAQIKRYIGRILMKWIMGLMITLVTALLRRAAAKNSVQSAPSPAPQKKPSSPAQPQPYKAWAVQDTIYQGMNQAELLTAYGQPDDKNRSGLDREVWIYRRGPTNDNRAQMTVILEKGIVADWAEG